MFRIHKLFSLNRPLLINNISEGTVGEIKKLFVRFNLEYSHINCSNINILSENADPQNALLIDGDIFDHKDIQNFVTKIKKTYFIVVLNYKSNKIFKYKTREIKAINLFSAQNIYDNFIYRTILRLKIFVLKTLQELLNAQSKTIEIFKYKVDKRKNKSKDAMSTNINNKRYSIKVVFLFSIMLLQSFSAFAFSNQEKNQVIKKSALQLANREQKKNKLDKYVMITTPQNELTYKEQLIKQNNDNKLYPNIFPYITSGFTSFIFKNSVEQEMQTISVNDYGLEGSLMRGFPVALYDSIYTLVGEENYYHGLIITSKFADKIIENSTNIHTYSDLIGEVISDSFNNKFSICNIIYVTDINANTEKNKHLFKYHERNVLAGKHLLEVYNDFVFLINPPISYKINLNYTLAYYPKGNDVINYIDVMQSDTIGEEDFLNFYTKN